MLGTLESFSGYGNDLKLAIIAAPLEVIEAAIDQSLEKFNVKSNFEKSNNIIPNDIIPEWSNHRDFSVKSTIVKVISVCKNLSLYFYNLDDCWQSLLISISKMSGENCLMVRSSPQDAEKVYYIQGVVAFDQGDRARVVRVIFDGKWDFFSAGLPLPGEDGSRYGQRLIRDRFPKASALEVANEYMLARASDSVPIRACVWKRTI